MTRDEANIITQLVQTVSGLVVRFDEQEKARNSARKADDHWRDRMEGKTDKLYARMDELADCIAAVPCVVDEKIAACRDEREEVTRTAVEDSERRHVLASVAVDWRTWAAFGIAAAGVAYGIWG